MLLKVCYEDQKMPQITACRLTLHYEEETQNTDCQNTIKVKHLGKNSTTKQGPRAKTIHTMGVTTQNNIDNNSSMIGFGRPRKHAWLMIDLQ